MEEFWTDYSVFEDEVNKEHTKDSEERKAIVQKYRAAVDDDYKLAKDEYVFVF